MTPTHYLHSVNSPTDLDKSPCCEGGGRRNLRNRGPGREATQPRPHSSWKAEPGLGTFSQVLSALHQTLF